MAERDAIGVFAAEFAAQKERADRAIRQLSPEEVLRRPGPEENSVASLMTHLAGNMRSRWTDFLATDGEKASRDREGEFRDPDGGAEAARARWEEGWRVLFRALEALGPGDLARTVRIRGEPQSVLAALVRQVSHYGYHVGQIVALARHLSGDRWEWISIPPGASDAYNRRMGFTPR